MNKRDQLAQLKKKFVRYIWFIFSFLILRVYIRLFIRIYLCVSLFWMSVPVLGYIITHCMSICISGSYLFLSFSLNICRGDRLYYHSLYVYRSVSWFVFLSLFLFQCLYCHWLQLYRYFSWSVFISLFFLFFFFFFWSVFLSMYAYIVTAWTCKSTSLDPRFSLFFSSLFTCVRVYYR